MSRIIRYFHTFKLCLRRDVMYGERLVPDANYTFHLTVRPSRASLSVLAKRPERVMKPSISEQIAALRTLDKAKLLVV
jgi:hypothetical protein